MALFQIKAIDEVEPLVPRFREAAKAQSGFSGQLCATELKAMDYQVQLHEVPLLPRALSH